MLIPFVKYQGTGNDFIIIDQTRQTWIRPEHYQLIKLLCDRHFGIGADGLMMLESSKASAFYMRYYNSDGNPSTMCGNGGRCIAHFAHELNLIGREGFFTALDGDHQVKIVSEEKAVKLQLKNVERVSKCNDNEYFLDTGSPHFVKFCKELPSDILAEARIVRYNETYRDDGVNVNFATKLSETEDILLATYERGVEGETLSCGTGATAVAIAASVQYGLTSPVKLLTKGGILVVSFDTGVTGFINIWLSGPAVKVFEGVFDINHFNK